MCVCVSFFSPYRFVLFDFFHLSISPYCISLSLSFYLHCKYTHGQDRFGLFRVPFEKKSSHRRSMAVERPISWDSTTFCQPFLGFKLMYNIDQYDDHVNLLWSHFREKPRGESVAYLRQLGALDESDPEAMLGSSRWYVVVNHWQMYLM